VLLWDDGEVRGFVLARKVMDEAQILDLAVRPGDQRKGVGRSLLEALAERAADSGCVKLSLEVDAGNASALAFYRDTGYAVVGRRRKFYNSTADAVLMDRILR
jgi:ribosomal-protein-alanine N-acetyltransferase